MLHEPLHGIEIFRHKRQVQRAKAGMSADMYFLLDVSSFSQMPVKRGDVAADDVSDDLRKLLKLKISDVLDFNRARSSPSSIYKIRAPQKMTSLTNSIPRGENSYQFDISSSGFFSADAAFISLAPFKAECLSTAGAFRRGAVFNL
jgi:hypothetical protein